MRSISNLVFSLSFLLLSVFCPGQKRNPSSSINGAFAFADSLFKGKAFIFEEQQMAFSQEITAITLKFNAAVAKNKAWFQEYANKNFKEGQGLPYHENFGVTREEYERYKKLGEGRDSIRLKTASVQEIAIRRENGMIRFEGKGDFAIFNYLTIDVNKKIITLAKDTLVFSAEINAPASTPFGKWHGYNWKFERSNQSGNSIQMETLTSKIIALNLGKTIPGNKQLLTLKLQRMENGANKQLFDILGFIK